MDEQDYKISEQLGQKFPEFHKVAGILASKVMASENKRLKEGLINYSTMQARMATVHAREDLILVVSFLQTIIVTMQRVFWLLLVIIGLLAYIAIK